MDSKTFTDFRAQLNVECEAILANRGALYATDDDRTINFKRNATERITPLDVWRVYAGKHWDSICSTVDALGRGEILVEEGQDLFGSFRDLRNYLDLGAALIAELLGAAVTPAEAPAPPPEPPPVISPDRRLVATVAATDAALGDFAAGLSDTLGAG